MTKTLIRFSIFFILIFVLTQVAATPATKMKDREGLEKLLIHYEGKRLTAYPDQNGLAIGIGHHPKPGTYHLGQVITEKECESLFKKDVDYAISIASTAIQNFERLDPLRQIILVSMVFELGEGGFYKFHHMIKSVENNDFTKASKEMLKSLWEHQVPERVHTLALIMEIAPVSSKDNILVSPQKVTHSEATINRHMIDLRSLANSLNDLDTDLDKVSKDLHRIADTLDPK